VKFKLDENIGRRGIELLRAAGHDVLTVADQGLRGAEDEQVLTLCTSEDRALITLDRDFCQVLRFPPAASAGIVVLNLGSRASQRSLLDRLRTLVAMLSAQPLGRELWIVEPGRVRIHLGIDEDGGQA
jgi:predicted nuclease of predicted toxin-antitoxin system